MGTRPEKGAGMAYTPAGQVCHKEPAGDKPELERVRVRSTSLCSVGYDPTTETLDVEFRDERVYRYRGVPPEVHAGLLAAPSLGRFFLAHIRGKYPCERL
ncbi:KTSC domain-containing protein [Polyangium aurulentum]|uniref:KTSC domain-containing protein n=1 Tax=Polyangium aurulentum TaxID=2567896 RepID=UPI00198112F3|nr:KTSC domain-containing protein [Polyangium aurulentum]UQA60926.1 KTSC domain-containing protein [Polyangium aurulentum]